ncbi:hypothetical protein S1OALGB6SA_192 [Olavius algarvensis spirochete endosymbiont]|nr:MAG: hypothetical protein [Olavius algarvensis spirochete endosymbiont]VDA99130.1 hypothetical protein S1OALGB6SA_192 [Olavius algarvensis spirochete endosymbiont]
MTTSRNPCFLALFSLPVLLSISCSQEMPVERTLRRLDLEYALDREGDFRVSVKLDDGRETIVGISPAVANEKIRVRSMWSVAGRIPGKLPDSLAENLLADVWESRIWGGWALAGITSDGRHVLVYITRIPASSSIRMFKEALMYTAETAINLREALSYLEEGV